MKIPYIPFDIVDGKLPTDAQFDDILNSHDAAMAKKSSSSERVIQKEDRNLRPVKGDFEVSKKDEKNYEKLDCVNWPDAFPQKPEVSFKAFHNGQYLFLQYAVTEDFTRALETVNGNDVYKDSCVEFFFQVDSEDKYYNFEWNAIGTVCMSYRPGRSNPEDAPKAVLDTILSESSWGKAPLQLTEGPNSWKLVVAIPATALFKSSRTSWSQMKGKANFYKCGDELPQPHYITWAPIATENPDYHRPEFFKEISFE